MNFFLWNAYSTQSHFSVGFVCLLLLWILTHMTCLIIFVYMFPYDLWIFFWMPVWCFVLLVVFYVGVKYFISRIVKVRNGGKCPDTSQELYLSFGIGDSLGWEEPLDSRGKVSRTIWACSELIYGKKTDLLVTEPWVLIPMLLTSSNLTLDKAAIPQGLHFDSVKINYLVQMISSVSSSFNIIGNWGVWPSHWRESATGFSQTESAYP